METHRPWAGSCIARPNLFSDKDEPTRSLAKGQPEPNHPLPPAAACNLFPQTRSSTRSQLQRGVKKWLCYPAKRLGVALFLLRRLDGLVSELHSKTWPPLQTGLHRKRGDPLLYLASTRASLSLFLVALVLATLSFALCFLSLSFAAIVAPLPIV